MASFSDYATLSPACAVFGFCYTDNAIEELRTGVPADLMTPGRREDAFIQAMRKAGASEQEIKIAVAQQRKFEQQLQDETPTPTALKILIAVGVLLFAALLFRIAKG